MPISSWRREKTEIADLGPIGIMREAFRQFWTYIVHFLLIHITLILPVVGVFAAVQNQLLVYDLRGASVSPAAFVLHPQPQEAVSFLYRKSELFHPLVLFSLLGTFAFQVAQGLSTSVILQSIGLIYTGQKVSFLGVLRSSIPILWLRLAVTTFYYVFIAHSVVLLETTALLLLLRFQSGGIWETSLKVVIAGVFGLLDLFLGVVFGVAVGVSVLEEAYGWAAFQKALKLLEGKGRVAIWFHVVWSRTVPIVITFALNRRGVRALNSGISKKGDYRSWSPTPLQEDYLNAVLFVSWTSLFWQLSSLCAGVQYVSFKAYHHENIADSRLFQERTKIYGRSTAESAHTSAGAAAGVAAAQNRVEVSIETDRSQTHSSAPRSDP